MKYFTFQQQFHAPIIAGVKQSTIRPKQKIQIGERFALRFWTGSPYRSKMGILGTATCCEVAEICIGLESIRVNGVAVDQDVVAKLEGFQSIIEMRSWFEKNHDVVFIGWIHVWETFTPYRAAGSGGDMLCRECGKPVFPGDPCYSNGYDDVMDIATSNCCVGRNTTNAAMPANAKLTRPAGTDLRAEQEPVAGSASSALLDATNHEGAKP